MEKSSNDMLRDNGNIKKENNNNMLRENKKTLIIASVITILPVLAGILLWDRLPDVMATHFGIDNEANGFSSKVFAVFGIPAFLLAMEWLGALVTSRDPRKQNISPKMFRLVLWIVPVVSLACAASIYPYNLGMRPDMTFFACLFMGFLFIVTGNYLPKARLNYTIGIKIPWTLDNEANWNRTHRLAGFIWVAGGVLMIIMGLTGLRSARLLIGIIIVMTLIPCVYSYWLHASKGM